MKKLFYYLLFPSILFSQTTPSVTPRADGEGTLGTSTYRWGEIYTTTPSIMDNSSRVPNTSWIRDYLSNNTPAVLQPEVINLDNTITENIEINKIYAIISNYYLHKTIYLPKITEDNLYSEISFHILIQSSDKYITLEPQFGDTFSTFGTPDTSFNFYNLYGTGDRVTIRATPSASNPTVYHWFFVDYTDNLISKGTLYIPESVRRKESLVFTKGVGKINFWWDDMDFTISQGNILSTNYDFLAFRDLETASPYTEFTQPVKAPTPTAADDSTNVATTAWVQDEIATKQNASNALTTDTQQTITGTKIYNSVAPMRFSTTSGGYYPFMFFFEGNYQWRWFQIGTALAVQHRDSVGTYTSVLNFSYQNKRVDFPVSPTVPTPTVGDNSTLAASTAFVQLKAAGALLTEATPASSSATGTKGMIRYDADYVYICTATDTWIRIAKDTW